MTVDFKSLHAFRADQQPPGGRSGDWPVSRIGEAVQACARWAAAYPALRYDGCSPCWSADCPRCGAADGLWITVHPTEQSWEATCCQASGPDPVSLAAFVAGAEGGAA